MILRALKYLTGKWRWLFGAVIGLLLVLFACDLAITASADVYDDVTEIPHHSVALVLGTAPTYGGRPNSFYLARISATAELFAAGKIDGVLVSGDNGHSDYNEPDQMRDDLVAAGIPREWITCDYAGFRTLDSVIRAKEVFGLDSFIVVSQPFHAERAVFLAHRHGLDAIGFAAAEARLGPRLKIRAREVLARTLAVADVVTGRRPRIGGPALPVATREALPR